MQGLALGLGPMFVAGLALGYFGGAYLDRRLGTTPWGVVGGLGLGALVGFREVWRIVRRLEALDESSRRELARRRREALGEPGSTRGSPGGPSDETDARDGAGDRAGG